MKLKFEPNLPYQQDAINAVCDVFAGQEVGEALFTVSAPKVGGVGVDAAQGYLYQGGGEQAGYANFLKLPDDELLANLQQVQLRNGLRQDQELRSRGGVRDLDFAVEMETGTGKTYVYLRTILELHKRYGWTKFIIVVPSVAIRAGVLKSLHITRDHLRSIYDGVAIEHHEYASGDLSRVRDFAISRNVRVMVMTVDAINKPETNVFYQQHEKTNFDRPIDLIRGTNPVVILDEPQSIEGGDEAAGAKAVRALNPLATLRYSATHLRKVHEVYRLNAVDAYREKLVKRIEVAGAKVEGAQPAVRGAAEGHNEKGQFAEGEGETAQGGPQRQRSGGGNDAVGRRGPGAVHRLAGLRGGARYRNHRRQGKRAPCAAGARRLDPARAGRAHGGVGNEDGYQRQLIDRAVTAHLDKELVLRPQKIKVLTLFFVERVADYRRYGPGGERQSGPLATMFEEVYRLRMKDQKYATLFEGIDRETAAEEVHNGYFAADKSKTDAKGEAIYDDFLLKSGKPQSSEKSREAEKEAYRLIMEAKEELLDLRTPLKFIFSHSALSRGVGQPERVPDLQPSPDGQRAAAPRVPRPRLRLCVGEDGNRVRDEDVNVLTVIAGESFEQYAKQLQGEYEHPEEGTGVVFQRVESHEFARLENAAGDMIGQAASESLWADLQAAGYLDGKGDVTDKPKDDLNNDVVTVPEGHDVDAARVVAFLRERAGRHLEVRNADTKPQAIRPQRAVIDTEAFRSLWERVRDRTTYRVDFDSDQLVKKCVASLANRDVERARIIWETNRIGMSGGGTHAEGKMNARCGRLTKWVRRCRTYWACCRSGRD